jgi:hypothetical protein
MNLEKLRPFIQGAAKSTNPKVKKAAETLVDQMVSAQEAEEIAQPTLHAQADNKPLVDKPKDDVDVKLDQWMPDLAETKPMESEFGKTASSYSADIAISTLPKSTQTDILKFVPDTSKKNKVVLYGMVVDELLPKVDHHNWEIAHKNILAECQKNKKAMADKFQDKIKDKYILLLNDSIIDGHHYLAMASVLHISCSLKVLDLTPLRFQGKIKTASSLYDYVIHKHGWKNPAKA